MRRAELWPRLQRTAAAHMEDPLTRIRIFASALDLLCETMGEAHSSVVQQLAWGIRDNVHELDEHRFFFRLHHPCLPEAWPSGELNDNSDAEENA
jgi:hypothetical protein